MRSIKLFLFIALLSLSAFGQYTLTINPATGQLDLVGAVVSSGGTNGVIYRDSSGNLTSTATGGAGTLCLTSVAGAAPLFGSCAGSAATAFSAITGSTNTSAAMVVGAGASLSFTSTGIVNASQANGVGFGSTTATSGNLLIGSGTAWVTQAITGDVTINASGVTAIGATKVTNAMLAGSIAASKLIGTDIAIVGTLTAGATGAGFTVALTTSTITGTLAAARGGTGVSNAATLTLGSSNQNWATLGTGIVKNTTTTGAITNAVAADVYGLWSGSCTSITFLAGAGACSAPFTLTTTGSSGAATFSAGVLNIPQYSGGGGSGTVTVVSSGSLGSTQCVTGGGTTTLQTPSSNCTVDSSGNLVGNQVTGTNGLISGASPPAVTAGTGGVIAGPEGTVPTVCAAVSVDCLYWDSTQHGPLLSRNNGSYLPIPQGPASTSSGNLASWNSANGGLLADAGVVAANVVTAGSTLTSTQLLCGSGSKALAVCNLSGDVTTSVSAVTTVVKVNGVAYSATAAAHSIEVITVANTTASNKVIPDCTDTGGNHINFTQSTDAFSCGTSSSGGGGSAGATLFSTTGSTTVTQTSATTLIGSVSGSTTVSANTFTAGQILHFNAQGYYSTPATPASLTIDLKIGGTTRITTGAVVQIASITNGVWNLSCDITTRTTGGSGTQIANCIFNGTGATITPGEAPMFTSSAWTIDTTATQAIDLQATWSTATGSPTITSTNIAAWIPGAPVTSVFGLTGAIGNLTGDVTTSGVAATIANSVVTSAKMNITTTTCTAPTVVTSISAGGVGTCTAPILTQNSQSAAYTTVLGDAGKMIYHPGADTTARTWTIDSNANVAYTIGTCITFVNDTSAGVLTIAITSDTLVLAGAGTTGSRTLAASNMATACKTTSTRWMIGGSSGLT